MDARRRPSVGLGRWRRSRVVSGRRRDASREARGGDASDGDDERVAIARDERGAARADGASMRDGSRASTRERDGERDASEKEPGGDGDGGESA